MDRTPDSSRGEQLPETGAVNSQSRAEMELNYETAETDPVAAPETTPHTTPQPTAPRASIDPSLDNPTRTGLSGGTWIALILGAVVLVMLLIFILQNNVEAQFAYFGWSFSLPLGIAMLFAAIAGVLVMGLFGSVRLIKLGRRVRKLEKEREAIKNQLR